MPETPILKSTRDRLKELHYIIIEGTNLRLCSRGVNVGIPTVYDTLEITQRAIDRENEARQCIDRLMKRVPSDGRTLVPMSVAKYNLKYRSVNELVG